MADNENVISLAERRRQRQGQGQKNGPGRGPGETEADQGSGAAVAAPAEKVRGNPIPGKLTWLHCATCGTLQYTEVFMTGGRLHNVCGQQVEEAVVDIDVRAEFTVAAINLERLKEMEKVVASQRAHYEQYQARLRIMAGSEPAPYPLTAEMLEQLPVAEVDAIGLLVPEALHNPAGRFAETAQTRGMAEAPGAPGATAESPDSAEPPDPSEPGPAPSKS